MICGVCEDDDDGWETIGESEVLAADDELKDGEPKDLVDADGDCDIQPGVPLPEPRQPTTMERRIRDLTHLPYRPWCRWCVQARRPNSHHRSHGSAPQRSVPLLVADYCYMRDVLDEELATVLVARLYPAKAIAAVVCDNKGIDEHAICRIAQFIKESGYSKVVYKSDQERAIRAMLEEAFRRSSRQGELSNPTLEQFVPEANAVGESQSNGRAENGVQRLEDLVRTYKAALEDHIGDKVPSQHPLIRWMVEHAASVYNRHVVTEDGVTPMKLSMVNGPEARQLNVESKCSIMYLNVYELN